MERTISSWTQVVAFLAINLLYLVVWGFAGVGKLIEGQPEWFTQKFGATVLGRFPGVTASFWCLTLAELLALLLFVLSVLMAEFLGRRPATWLCAALAMSLLVFVQLGFGQWLTKEYNGAFQQFVYFGVTLVSLQYVQKAKLKPETGVGTADKHG